MRMDRMTSRLQGALADAQSLAAGSDHASLEPIHLLSVLVEPGPGTLLPLLVQAGGQSEKFADGVAAALDRVAKVSTPTGGYSAFAGIRPGHDPGRRPVPEGGRPLSFQ